jgi:copper chaperone CopZ
VNRFVQPREGETSFLAMVRFHTIGDATCTGCFESIAAATADVVAEVAAARITERGATRGDDRISEAGMEDRGRLFLMGEHRRGRMGAKSGARQTVSARARNGGAA